MSNKGESEQKRNQEGVEKCSVPVVEDEKNEVKTEEMGRDNKREVAEQQCPGSMQWRQARWLQGTEHPAKYGHQDAALSYFLEMAKPKPG